MGNRDERREPPQCSFCGKQEPKVGPLAQGPWVFICGSCALEALVVIKAEGHHGCE